MITVIISLIWIAVCVFSAITLGSSYIFIGKSSLFPALIVVFTLYISITDFHFPNSGREMLHTSDDFLTYDERVKMYRNRSVIFITGIIPQFFLIFYFSDLLKAFVAGFLLVAYVIEFLVAGNFAIRKEVRARLSKEDAELKEQQRKEELGKLK